MTDASSAPIRVAVADDHALVAEGLATMLALDPYIVHCGIAPSARDALALVQSTEPDVLLLEIGMAPEGSAFDAATRIMQAHPHVRIIALTNREERAWVLRAHRSGFSGYVLKRSTLHQLLTAIRAVVAGSRYYDPLVVSHLLNPDAEHSALTEREQEVLRRMALGYSNKEIGRDLAISIKTVETHRARAFAKLGFHHRTELVRYARAAGWLNNM